jgi:MoxR-like ATPase
MDTTYSRFDLADFQEKVNKLRKEISTVIVGQERAIDLILTAILADGHVLVEGVPGVAKTLLSRLISKLIDADFKRIQFTPDLMPSDVLGTNVFNIKTQEFEFHKGPIFSQIVLVDEINRAPAKTQAALFEVMEERQSTVDGVTRAMSPLYTVLATQNPVEQEGTYRLPEAQLDRFMMKVNMGYPSYDEEVTILERHQANVKIVKLEDIKPILSVEQLLELRTYLDKVIVDKSLLNYIAQITQQTRLSQAIQLGASPRSSIYILKGAKAYALLQGRDFVTPDDIKTIVPPVLEHRLIITADAEMQGFTVEKLAQALLDKIEVPK